MRFVRLGAMPNHVHPVMKANGTLSETMRWLTGGKTAGATGSLGIHRTLLARFGGVYDELMVPNVFGLVMLRLRLAGVGEVGVIQDVEHIGGELGVQALRDLRVLADAESMFL